MDLSFYDFYNKMHGGEPAKPAQYDMEDYTKQVTSSPVNGAGGGWELTPLEGDDFARAATDDVVDAYVKMHQGKNPCGMGEPLDDEGLAKYTGIPTEGTLNEEKKEKVWRAKRQDIIDLWGRLRPFLPLDPQPVPQQHEGTRYRYDGLRITGTSSFINSILSRLKDLLRYDNYPGMKVDVEYEQIQTKEHQLKEGPRFVCYVHVVEEKIDMSKPP